MRGYNLLRDCHDFFDFGLRLHRLWNVHVHFISVEVCIVGSGNTQVKSESLEIKDFYAMAHHGHFVQRRLPIKNDVIVVLEMPLNDVARFKMRVGPVL